MTRRLARRWASPAVGDNTAPSPRQLRVLVRVSLRFLPEQPPARGARGGRGATGGPLWGGQPAWCLAAGGWADGPGGGAARRSACRRWAAVRGAGGATVGTAVLGSAGGDGSEAGPPDATATVTCWRRPRGTSSRAAPAFWTRWKRSAIWTASGAPLRAP